MDAFVNASHQFNELDCVGIRPYVLAGELGFPADHRESRDGNQRSMIGNP